MQCSIVNSIRLDVGQLVFFAVVLAFVTVLSSTEVCAKAQHVGGECNWTKNCVASVEGVGPAWAGNAVTCAVPKDHSPETCGSNDPKKNDFYGYVQLTLSSFVLLSSRALTLFFLVAWDAGRARRWVHSHRMSTAAFAASTKETAHTPARSGECSNLKTG